MPFVGSILKNRANLLLFFDICKYFCHFAKNIALTTAFH